MLKQLQQSSLQSSSGQSLFDVVFFLGGGGQDLSLLLVYWLNSCASVRAQKFNTAICSHKFYKVLALYYEITLTTGLTHVSCKVGHGRMSYHEFLAFSTLHGQKSKN